MVYERIEETLNRALALVGRCDEVYRLGGPKIRRLSNQLFFEKLLICEDDAHGGASVARAILREPWATLLADDFRANLGQDETNPRP